MTLHMMFHLASSFRQNLIHCRDDSKLLYEILTNNGIQAEYHEYKGALHAFIHYSKVMDDAEDALRRGAHFFAHNCGLDPRN